MIRSLSLSLSSALGLGLGVVVVACSAGNANSGFAACTPGQSIACACAGGLGAQVCSADYTFGPCSCGGAARGGDADPSAAVPGDVTTPGGPAFLSSGTSAASITQGKDVTFIAVLTDPDGIDDLIGGSLKSPDGLTTYGAFQTSAAEGSYSLHLTWAQIHAAKAISFQIEEPRAFVAEFFDTAGHRATKTLSVKLHCNGLGACGGDCIDLSIGETDNDNITSHCGACGTTCANSGCTQGKCADWSPCVAATIGNSCAAECAARGSSCTPSCKGDQGYNKAAIRTSDSMCQNGESTSYPCTLTFSQYAVDVGASVECCCAL